MITDRAAFLSTLPIVDTVPHPWPPEAADELRRCGLSEHEVTVALFLRAELTVGLLVRLAAAVN